MEVSLEGPAPAVATCVRHLQGHGARLTGGGSGVDGHARVSLGSDEADALRVAISWTGPALVDSRHPADEPTVQAMSGLMQVHGRDAGRPRRLGLDVASVAAGVLAAQSVLAAAIGRRRGWSPASAETSVLEAAFVLTSHYIAAATCPDRGDWPPPRAAADPGPPFRSADGHRFEIETMDSDAFRRFLTELGAGGVDVGHAWGLFRARYFRGACTLPPGIHAAAARLRFGDIVRIAAASRVSLVRLRSCAEVLADRAPASEHVAIGPLLERPPGDRAQGDGVGTAERDGIGPARRDGIASGGGSRPLPLDGMLVVEATSRMQGPLAGLLLQMLGARVVRVEPPGGDPIRLVAPYTDGDGYFFACFNHGKEPVELDLAAPSGRAAFLDLVADADVFLQNWGPGRDVRWGLAAEQLAARNPRLTYVRATGWGGAGPPGRPIGTDFLVQAHAGMGDTVEPAGDDPAPSRVLLTDCLGALVTCEAALGGLWRREGTATGQQAEPSLLAGGMALQASVLEAIRAGAETGRTGGRSVWGPLDRPVAAGDGFVAVGGGRDGATLARLADACGIDPAEACAVDVEGTIAARLAEGSTALWAQVLPPAGVPCAAVAPDVGTIPADPRFAPLFEELPGGARVPRSPWRFGA